MWSGPAISERDIAFAFTIPKAKLGHRTMIADPWQVS
jgi:hypothetical protein